MQLSVSGEVREAAGTGSAATTGAARRLTSSPEAKSHR